MSTVPLGDDPNESFRILQDASRRVHGYLVHTWFERYLAWIHQSLRRLVAAGGLERDGRPGPETNYRITFDPRALDEGLLLDMVGLYVYVLASHKWTNYHLMAETPRKRVLYLRGYDIEGAIAVADGIAMGISSANTTGFNQTLAEALGREYDVFKALSPRDLHWESIGAQKRFDDLDALIRYGNGLLHSFYVHADHWQDDIESMMDRADRFVVYLSSITPSVLWEIDTLRGKGRAQDATIVFDEGAMAFKAGQPELGTLARRTAFEEVRWENARSGPPEMSPEELRAELSTDFLVLSPEEFEAGIEEERARIAASKPRRPEASRGQPIPFRFSPALVPAAMQQVLDLDAAFERELRSRLAGEPIENLPWFFSRVQLKLFTSVLLGRHDETGWALAVYAGIHRTLMENEVSPTAVRPHFEMAEYYAPRLMAYGRADQFGDYSEQALHRYDTAIRETSAAVQRFLDEVRRRQG